MKNTAKWKFISSPFLFHIEMLFAFASTTFFSCSTGNMNFSWCFASRRRGTRDMFPRFVCCLHEKVVLKLVFIIICWKLPLFGHFPQSIYEINDAFNENHLASHGILIFVWVFMLRFFRESWCANNYHHRNPFTSSSTFSVFFSIPTVYTSKENVCVYQKAHEFFTPFDIIQNAKLMFVDPLRILLA